MSILLSKETAILTGVSKKIHHLFSSSTCLLLNVSIIMTAVTNTTQTPPIAAMTVIAALLEMGSATTAGVDGVDSV